MLFLGEDQILKMVTVSTTSRFLSSVVKFRPITGDFTDPGGCTWVGMKALVRGLASVETAFPLWLHTHFLCYH